MGGFVVNWQNFDVRSMNFEFEGDVISCVEGETAWDGVDVQAERQSVHTKIIRCILLPPLAVGRLSNRCYDLVTDTFRIADITCGKAMWALSQASTGWRDEVIRDGLSAELSCCKRKCAVGTPAALRWNR